MDNCIIISKDYILQGQKWEKFLQLIKSMSPLNQKSLINHLSAMQV